VTTAKLADAIAAVAAVDPVLAQLVEVVGPMGRPELTAERFLPNPYEPDPATRMYRTGDLVTRLPDGSLEFHGRTDDQVKIRGFRVELGELETALASHPAVRESVAVARQPEGGERQIVAYISADPSTFLIPQLRALVDRTLPRYMMPSVILRVDGFSLTRNGKIDRSALPTPPERTRREAATPPAVPGTPVEALLVTIVGDLLNIDQVGVTDSFDELGGDSLLALDTLAEVQNLFGVSLPLATVAEDWSIRDLAAAVDAATRPADTPGSGAGGGGDGDVPGWGNPAGGAPDPANRAAASG
jgi:acyl carrier protein